MVYRIVINQNVINGEQGPKLILTKPKSIEWTTTNRGYAWRKYSTAQSYLEMVQAQRPEAEIEEVSDEEFEKLLISSKAKVRRWVKRREKAVKMMSKYSLPAAKVQTKPSEQLDIENALQNSKTKTEAAKTLGIHPDTLRRRIKKYNINA